MIRSMVVVLAVLCLVVAGCGGDKDGNKSSILPGGGGGAASAAGVYVLDAEKMTPLLEEMMMSQMGDDLDEMPEEQREMALSMAKASIKPMIASMKFDVNLKDDGTFTVKGTNVEGTMDVRGTWKQDGSRIWFTTTYEDGEEKTDAEAMPGEIKDGDIHFKPEADMPFPLILKRK